jgi:DNA polymerase V
MDSIIGKPNPSPRPLRLPLFETLIPAGFPSPAADYVQNAIDLHERLIHNTQATFFVRTTGDSMRDVGILDGCVLVVDASRTPVSGNIVVASIDGKYVVKRLKKVRGQFELHSENALVAYPVLRPSSDLQIFGVVTSHIVEHLKKPTRKAKQ